MDFIRSKKSSMAIDMTPLIDVVFQLLVFFMLSSSFITPIIKLNLPKAVTQDKRDAQRVVVTIDKDGNFFVNRTPVSGAGLIAAIEAQLISASRKSVDLRGDGETPYKYFVKAMDCARQAGASQVNVVHGGGATK